MNHIKFENQKKDDDDDGLGIGLLAAGAVAALLIFQAVQAAIAAAGGGRKKRTNLNDIFSAFANPPSIDFNMGNSMIDLFTTGELLNSLSNLYDPSGIHSFLTHICYNCFIILWLDDLGKN